jgi:hypothetical protein
MTPRAGDLGAFRQSRSPTTLAKHQENHMQTTIPVRNAAAEARIPHVLDHTNKGTRHDVSECNSHRAARRADKDIT